MNDTQPMNYLTPIYTEWAVIVSELTGRANVQGVMLIVYLTIPESPYWCAARARHDQGRKVIGFLNGGIDGYDVAFHYNLIQRAVEKEQSFQKTIDGDRGGFLQELLNVKEVFVGVNGVCVGYGAR